MSEVSESLPASAVRARRPWRKVAIFGTISLVNMALLVLLVAQLLTPASRTPASPLVGHAAPAFALARLSAQSEAGMLSLADFRGKAIVLNFWASWCDPCKEEAALLENTWRQMQTEGKNVVFLGLDFQESRSDALRFLQDYSITYPLALDTQGTAANHYAIASLPDTIFINRQGVVVSKVSQQITAQLLNSNLQLIL